MNRLIASLSLLFLALATSAQAMLVQPAPVQPFAAAAYQSSSAYAFILDSAVSSENSCRNNPVDLSHPSGLYLD